MMVAVIRWIEGGGWVTETEKVSAEELGVRSTRIVIELYHMRATDVDPTTFKPALGG
jgi:hypothetical protein